MRRILSIIILSIICEAIYATGQTPERIIVRGDTLLLYSLPFEKTDSARRIALRQRLQETKAAWTTSSVRGYCGLWRLDKDSLHLEGIYDGNFEMEVSGDGIFRKGEAATWFSGELRVVYPEEKTVYYQPDGFEHYFKNETLFTVENGARKGAKNYSNRMIGNRKTFYEQTIPSIANAFVFPPQTDSIVYQTVYVAFAATPNKLGKITHFDHVKMVLFQQDGTKEIVTDVFHPYLRELLRRLELAEPYALTLYGKVQPITIGISLRTRQDTKKRP